MIQARCCASPARATGNAAASGSRPRNWSQAAFQRPKLYSASAKLICTRSSLTLSRDPVRAEPLRQGERFGVAADSYERIDRLIQDPRPTGPGGHGGYPRRSASPVPSTSSCISGASNSRSMIWVILARDTRPTRASSASLGNEFWQTTTPAAQFRDNAIPLCPDGKCGCGYVKSSAILLCAVIMLLVAWRHSTGAIRVDQIATRKAPTRVRVKSLPRAARCIGIAVVPPSVERAGCCSGYGVTACAGEELNTLGLAGCTVRFVNCTDVRGEVASRRPSTVHLSAGARCTAAPGPLSSLACEHCGHGQRDEDSEPRHLLLLPRLGACPADFFASASVTRLAGSPLCQRE